MANSRNTTVRVALATHLGGYAHARVCDSVIADALYVRGADPEFILCDAALPACQMTKLTRVTPERLVEDGQTHYCSTCFTAGVSALAPHKHPVRMMTDNITGADKKLAREVSLETPLNELKTLVWEGLQIGEHANAGALRYLARGDIDPEPLGEQVLRLYAESAILTAQSTRAVVRNRGYEILVAHHGIYTPQGIATAAARAEGVRIITYNPAYRRHSFIFSHDDTYHHTMISEPVNTWRALELKPRMKEELARYLKSRRSGVNDWIWFHNEPIEDHRKALESIGADPNKKYALALTSVVWDAQLHYASSAFENMKAWLIETVRAWADRTDDLQLLIRVHPAEIRGAIPSRQRAEDDLRHAFPELPKNVFVVSPENDASTYALCDHANAVIIFNTKTGVEAAAAGKRVIVAGEAWVRGKGFTRDVIGPADYQAALSELPYKNSQLPPYEHDLALKYAYHFFFRRMIPLPFIKDDGAAKFWIDKELAKDLRPGSSAGLDTICNGILEGTPFIYPAETMSSPFGHEASGTA